MDDEEKIAKIYHLLKDTPMEYILENPLLLKIEKVIDEDKTNTTDKEKIKNALKFIDKRMKVLDELGKKTGSYGESGEWYHLERIKEYLTNEES